MICQKWIPILHYSLWSLLHIGKPFLYLRCISVTMISFFLLHLWFCNIFNKQIESWFITMLRFSAKLIIFVLLGISKKSKCCVESVSWLLFHICFLSMILLIQGTITHHWSMLTLLANNAKVLLICHIHKIK